MKLRLLSALWPGIAMTWPPDNVDALVFNEDGLVLTFKEPLSFEYWMGRDEIPVWQAVYNGRGWSVKRVG